MLISPYAYIKPRDWQLIRTGLEPYNFFGTLIGHKALANPESKQFLMAYTVLQDYATGKFWAYSQERNVETGGIVRKFGPLPSLSAVQSWFGDVELSEALHQECTNRLSAVNFGVSD